jgi:hypothetical protein
LSAWELIPRLYDKIQRLGDRISNLPDQALPLPATNRLAATRWAILLGVFTTGLLFAYGLLRFPSVLTTSPTGVCSLIGDVIILVLYAVVGWSGPFFANRIHPQILRRGNLFGLLAGLWVAYQTKSWRSGLLAAIWSAVIAGVIWFVAVLFVFYLFNGTPQQTQVFRAEGNYADFAARQSACSLAKGLNPPGSKNQEDRWTPTKFCTI